MAKIVRRAAQKAIISAKDSHSLLGLLIFDEKIVCHNIRKLTEAEQNASLSLLKWAKQEDNLALDDVFSKSVEVGSIWAEVFKQHSDKHMQYRSTFKEILREERILDEIRKREVQYSTKLHKLQKQMEHNKRKNDIAKTKSISEEMTEILSLSEEARAELEVKFTQHEILKAKKLREALHLKSESIETLAQQALSVSKAFKELADLIPDTPTQVSEEKVYPGAGKTRRVVTDLSKEVQLEPVVKADDAVSALKQTKAVESPPSSPSAVPSHQKLHTSTSATGLQPKIVEEPSLSTQRFGHAQSLNDIRPAPLCPPPPLPRQGRSRQPKGLCNQMFGKPQSLEDLSYLSQPKIGLHRAQNRRGNQWYARSKVIDEETDSEDSDGYTEPLTDPTYCVTQVDENGYKSLARHTNDNSNNNINTNNEVKIAGGKSRITHQALHTSKTENTVHYDGCYLELQK